MHRNNILLVMPMLSWIFSSCIRSYEPEILADDEKKYVITGQVTDESELQTIHVSISSSIDLPKYLPVTNCKVKIIDDLGHIFLLGGQNNGDYSTMIDSAFLQPGRAFQVEVFTHEGDYIISDFDTLKHGPEVDSIYYMREEKIYNPAAPIVMGVQFYLNLNATATDSRYYRLEPIETWEYHSPYPLEWYYDGIVHHIYPPDSSRLVCWKTVRVPDIFTMTTDNLVGNYYDHYRLQFVDNITAKLVHGYSLLVKQYALTHEAYLYFENLRVNSHPDGGLYEKQPLAVRGNLHNTTHPEKEVLGFFSASTVHSKRIFVDAIPDLPYLYEVVCQPQEIVRPGLSGFKPKDYPIYLQGDTHGLSGFSLDEQCVNCLALGGVNKKPDFWPK